ncbi:hypothetical protein HPB50_004890 [Hyalomma asiaticum]|uniref:Uncharacterized protein n=1 Tax=Hyalomma asiaticum TaxID=266040 RepID=A0ACB7SEK2_HYAAI|nr:hypothetical protein HPB50_004890 [Hyalomma asiaticum]
MADEAERLVAVGKQIGYEGTALQEFLREVRTAHRQRLREEKERKRGEDDREKAQSDRRLVEMEKELQLLHARSDGVSNSGGSDGLPNAAAVPAHFAGVSAQRAVYLVDRSVRTLLEARIDIDTPYYRGEVLAACMEDPLFDLILGNIEGARAPADPDAAWSASMRD